MSNLSLKNFKKPTPEKWRKIGYGFLSLSAAIGGYLEMLTPDFPYKQYVVGAVVSLLLT
jgi:hypothetical protein